MVSNSNVKTLFIILIGILFVSACGPSVPTEPSTITSTPTEHPTEQVTPTPQPTTIPATEPASPTLTEPQFVLPGGRLLLTAYSKSGGHTVADAHFKYVWLQLPNLTVQDYPYLVGEYPTVDFAATLSPDGSHLAFEHRVYTQSSGKQFPDISASVNLTSLDDNKIIQIAGPFSNDFITDNIRAGDSISWSANSQIFAFKRAAFEYLKNIYVYDVVSSNFTTLTIETAPPGAFELSPDGTQIAFTDLGASPSLSLINADGSNERVIVEGWIGSNLAWHPDGKRIFFVLDKPPIAIYSVDISSGAITQITPENYNLDTLVLSPDGKYLTYYENGLWIVPTDGGEPLQLAGAGTRQWVWSPDSRYIAYVTPATVVFVTDLLGNEREQIYFDEQWLPGLIGWLP